METLFSRGLLDSLQGLLAAGLIGLAFGFWLERAGFGSSKRLAGMFYFRDFAVFQVMFSALVTAMLGLLGLSALGWVELDSLYRMDTYLWPQIVGGVIFGIGFVVGGWCPGTAMVGLGSGKADALVFLLGAGGGSLAYAALPERATAFASSGYRGLETLPDTFGVTALTAALAVSSAALVGFAAIGLLMRSRRRAAGEGGQG